MENTNVKFLPKDVLSSLEPSADGIGIETWGCKKDLELEGETFDAFIFQLIVPDKFIDKGEMSLKTKEGLEATRFCFKIVYDSSPRYLELGQSDIKPHYLGKLSNDQHVVEMITKYDAKKLGDIMKMKKALKSGNVKLFFSLI